MAAGPGLTPPARLQLRCTGVVQGVGFRPALHRLAVALGLQGELRNQAGAVLVDLQGERLQLEAFLQQLPGACPVAARLESCRHQWLPPLPDPPGRGGVRIEADAPRPLGEGFFARGLVADRAPCAACRAELADPTNRRHRYPFISCALCGPRYSIATAEPYARAHTTLAPFRLCSACGREFHDPADRRFHAETTGCPACGPRLALLAATGEALAGCWPLPPGGAPPSGSAAPEEADRLETDRQETVRQETVRHETEAVLAAAVGVLRAGGVLALQGVGGFQLLVDARQEAAVARLRRRKQRPHKPLALLVADLSALPVSLRPSAVERELLTSAAAPIVLLQKDGRFSSHGGPARDDPWAAVAPDCPSLGVMLPASPLHHLLAAAHGAPLVATSGNGRGEPMLTDPHEALERLGGPAHRRLADALLVHNRPIARVLDDSVLQVIEDRPMLLRRARGYGPEPLGLSPQLTEGRSAAVVLALGGDQRAAPALLEGARLWLAPHLGTLHQAPVLARLERGLAPCLALESGTALPEVDPAPLHWVADAHPGYLSHQLARQATAASLNASLTLVQHHRAHGLAVVAEHGLPLPVLALALDGLGYGQPPAAPVAAGQPNRLWGGELLVLDGQGEACTLASLRPFPLPGGERALREPWRSALGLLAALPEGLAHWLAQPVLQPLRTALPAGAAALWCEALPPGCGARAQSCGAPLTSSAGRLLDGLAVLLGLGVTASHGAQLPLALQARAARMQPVEPPPGRVRNPLGRDPQGSRQVGSERGHPPMVRRRFRGQHRCRHAPADAERWTWDGAPEALLPLVPAALPLGELDWAPLLLQLLLREPAASAPGLIHRVLAAALAGACQQAARRWPVRQVVLSGGCFQNRLLLETTAAALRRRGLQPFWGQAVPVNDGGLAVGQAWAAALALRPSDRGSLEGPPP